MVATPGDQLTADTGHRHLADGLARQRGFEALAHAAVAVLIAGTATSTRAAFVTGACVAALALAAGAVTARRNRSSRTELGLPPFAVRFWSPTPTGERSYVADHAAPWLARVHGATTWWHWTVSTALLVAMVALLVT